MIPDNDLAIYGVHAAFWGAFGMTRVLVRSGAPVPAGVQAAEATTAPYSRALIVLHMAAFGLMYFGIANAVLPGRVPAWFPGQRIAGTLVMAAGAGLMCWSLVFFRSWRFRAKLDPGHQLATGGPFAIVRHPIYAGLSLLGLGSALWVPTSLLWISAALMFIGSDLRGRAEEKVLARAFGEAYRQYCRRTRRFIPGVY